MFTLSHSLLIYIHTHIHFFVFWPHLITCGILAPQPGIEPMCLVVKAWSPNCWIAREVPHIRFLFFLNHLKVICRYQVTLPGGTSAYNSQEKGLSFT